MRVYLPGELRRLFLACALITRKIMRSTRMHNTIPITAKKLSFTNNFTKRQILENSAFTICLPRLPNTSRKFLIFLVWIQGNLGVYFGRFLSPTPYFTRCLPVFSRPGERVVCATFPCCFC